MSGPNLWIWDPGHPAVISAAHKEVRIPDPHTADWVHVCGPSPPSHKYLRGEGEGYQGTGPSKANQEGDGDT